MISFWISEKPIQSDENEIKKTIQLKFIDLEGTNHLNDLNKEIKDKNTNLLHFYKTLLIFQK